MQHASQCAVAPRHRGQQSVEVHSRRPGVEAVRFGWGQRPRPGRESRTSLHAASLATRRSCCPVSSRCVGSGGAGRGQVKAGLCCWESLCHETGHRLRTGAGASDGLKYGVVCCTPRLAQSPHSVKFSRGARNASKRSERAEPRASGAGPGGHALGRPTRGATRRLGGSGRRPTGRAGCQPPPPQSNSISDPGPQSRVQHGCRAHLQPHRAGEAIRQRAAPCAGAPRREAFTCPQCTAAATRRRRSSCTGSRRDSAWRPLHPTGCAERLA